jgi:ribosomal protein L11 methyltransferase
MQSLDQKPKNYFVLQLEDVPRNSVDIVTSLGFELGAAGSEEALLFEQKSLAYDAVPVETPFANLKFYFDQAPIPSSLESLRNYCHSLSVIEEENRDWMSEWKKHFRPVPLVGPYWVVPSWFETPMECERPIFIDPGMAFGTGTHETTQLACELVRAALLNIPKATVLDVGSGTGILSIIASQDGAAKIVANDIDPEARRVARENFEKNKLSPNFVTELSTSQIDETFDVVIANILDHVLLQLAPDLIRLKKTGGYLVLSGILDEHEQDFIRRFFLENGLKINQRLSRNEWVAFLVS